MLKSTIVVKSMYYYNIKGDLSDCKEINHTFAKKLANGKSRFIKRKIQNV